MKVSLYEQIKCAQREIGMRRVVYPKLVASKKMTQETADRELNGMEAILHTLELLAEKADDGK